MRIIEEGKKIESILIKESVTHADLQHEHRAKRLENDSHVGQNDHVFYANENRECDK